MDLYGLCNIMQYVDEILYIHPNIYITIQKGQYNDFTIIGRIEYH